MKVLHISAECYPAAKAGGLGDVVGALPIYLNKAKISTGVVIPKYRTKWILQQDFQEVHSGYVRMHDELVYYAVEQLKNDRLSFPFYVVNIPGKFDRPGVYTDSSGYGYSDEVERAICFQQAVLQWVMVMPKRPEILHCHDHHTGLIPFFVKHAPEFNSLANIPTVFTIHNGEYHGAFSWRKMYILPLFNANARGLLDWGDTINPLATGIKNCWKLTTVSPSYLEELRYKSNGLEWLINHEAAKSIGILNGIDAKVWNPVTDPFLTHQHKTSISKYKAGNKSFLSKRFNIYKELPIITFIGRLVKEKGADLIPDLVSQFLQSGQRAAFLVLGTGESHLQNRFRSMTYQFPGFFDASIEYNEELAHRLYAGSDFLIMPSRVEPCGLNQMYALRYGTVPIVRKIGGLKDSIIDMGEPDGVGITFNNFSIDDAMMACYRAIDIYHNKKVFPKLLKRIMSVDFSWEKSAKQYVQIYQQLSDKV